MDRPTIEAPFDETRSFGPSAQCAAAAQTDASAHIAGKDYDTFWAEHAEQVVWRTRWSEDIAALASAQQS